MIYSSFCTHGERAYGKEKIVEDSINPLFGKVYKDGRYQEPLKKESESKPKPYVFEVEQPEWAKEIESPTSLTAFYNIDIPPQDMIVDGLFAVAHCGYIYSGTGKGKSLNGMILGICVATGKPFGRYRIPKPRKVLYLDGEMHPAEFQARIKRMNFTDKDYEKCIENFYYWNGLYGKDFPDLSDPSTFNRFFQFCFEMDIDLVIIDNYFCMTRMKDYNSPQEIQALEDNFVKVAKGMGIAILFIDHTNKAGGDYGNITKLGFAEFALKIDYDRESGLFTMKREKGRSLNMNFEDMVYRISPEDNSVQVLDLESAKTDPEAKAIERNLVGNIFKDKYEKGCNKSQTLRESIESYKEQHGDTDMHYKEQTLRTFIPTWIADMGYVDDGKNINDISNHQS